MRAKRLSAVVSSLAVIFAIGARANANSTIHVAAAANLQKVFDKAILPAFARATGVTVVPTYGSTKLLATQIENGDPVDVFVAADKKTPYDLAAKGELEASTERVYAYGKLVLWTLKDAPAHPASVADLKQPVYAKIAVANPRLAPYGAAAMDMIQKARLTRDLQTRIVFAENIDQTLQYARSGNASVAITALSLVIDDKADPYYIVPASAYSPIAQAAAVVHSSTHQADAVKFLKFLASPAARKILKEYGYGLP